MVLNPSVEPWTQDSNVLRRCSFGASDRASGNLTTSFASSDRVPPLALAVAQAEREGGLNNKYVENNISHKQKSPST
jgi:hypothetical protein